MKTITHTKQKELWEQEHKTPYVLHQMDAITASSGVVKFWEWLQTRGKKQLKGIEMGCDKGRNGIWRL